MIDFEKLDAENQALLKSLKQNNKFLSFENLNEGFPETETFDDISREIGLNTPFGKKSSLYKSKSGTFRAYLENNNLYTQAKNKFKDFDLESIYINVTATTFNNSSYLCEKGNTIKIIQHVGTGIEKYYNEYFKSNSEKLSTYIDNFLWFQEGENSNVITFHFFASNIDIKNVVCTMGSDIFDCLKQSTNINATGGFTIKNDEDKYIVNPNLKDFKTQIIDRLDNLYDKANFENKFRLPFDLIREAIDNEFLAEGDYQRTVDWLFEKIGITTSFKDFVNDFKDTSKTIKSYRIDENQYLPFLPNFDPIFNDSLLKAFGINPNVAIEEYFKGVLYDDTEDIKKFQLQEKEVNWVYAYNAAFCGLWNALVDTADGFIEIIPGLYNIFTDRAAFKEFLHFIKEFFEQITELLGKIEKWELENASYSVYRYEYTECYAIGLLATLFIPMPKTAIAEKLGATLTNAAAKSIEVVSELTQSLLKFIKAETLATAYKMGLRVGKESENYILSYYNLALTSGSQQTIASQIEKITQTGLLPIREAVIVKGNHFYIINNLIIKFKINTKNIDLIEANGDLFFRLGAEEFVNFIEFFKLTAAQRRIKIKKATKVLRLTSTAKYNPAIAKAKGYNIPLSKNGISPDFAKTPYLYNSKSIVKIRITGSRSKDFEVAFKKMGITDKKTIEKIENEFVWHHLDDLNENLECTMQLVERKAHDATIRHVGSCGQSEKVLNTKYKP